MGRVALVTGGSRGIGASISKALKEAGFTVAANYAGNDEAASSFTADAISALSCAGVKSSTSPTSGCIKSAALAATSRNRLILRPKGWPQLTLR